jgi:hypothetical protein
MVNKQNVFNYLDGLRRSGVTNMFGAPAYVRAVFPVSQAEAVKLVAEWMEDYSQRPSENE